MPEPILPPGYGGAIEHRHIHISQNPDSIEVGTPGKRRLHQSLWGFHGPGRIPEKIKAAYALKQHAAELLTGGGPNDWQGGGISMIPNSQSAFGPQNRGPGIKEQGRPKTGVMDTKNHDHGRWMCRKSPNYVAPETRVCRCCGGESFTVEWDENALSAAHLREQEREEERKRG